MSDNLTPWLAGAAETGHRFAFNQFKGNGSTIRWGINFSGIAPGYLDRSHLKYYVTEDATGFSTDTYVVPANAFVSDVILELKHPVTGQPIATGSTLSIFRDSPKQQPIPNFNDGSIIDEGNLDTGFRQAVYAAAEMVDRFGVSSDKAGQAFGIASRASDRADTAINTANAASTKADTAISTANTAKSTADTAKSTADTAKSTADTAKATADGINAKATQALSTADSSNTKADTAVTTANAAKSVVNAVDGKAQQALDTANAIDGKATTALNTANSANAKADQALGASSGTYNNHISIFRNGDEAAVKLVDGSRSNWGQDLWAIVAANVGNSSDLYFNRVVNGAYAGSPIIIQRSTGLVKLTSGADIDGAPLNVRQPSTFWSGMTLTTANGSHFALNTDTPKYRSVKFKTASGMRWEIGTNDDAEAGSNQGSHLFISRWADDGSFLGVPVRIKRNTGVVAFEQRPQVAGNDIWDSGNFDPSSKLAANGDATRAGALTHVEQGNYNGYSTTLGGGYLKMAQYEYGPYIDMSRARSTGYNVRLHYNVGSTNFEIVYPEGFSFVFTRGASGQNTYFSPDGNISGARWGGWLGDWLNAQLGGRALGGARVQWDSGIAEWGIMDISSDIGAHVIDIPAPWVMMGMRKEGGNTRCYLRGVVLRNQ